MKSRQISARAGQCEEEINFHPAMSLAGIRFGLVAGERLGKDAITKSMRLDVYC